MTCKMFSEEKLSKMVKKQKSIGIKSSYSNTSYGFEYKKNCMNKKKSRTGKAYAYWMFLTLKTTIS